MVPFNIYLLNASYLQYTSERKFIHKLPLRWESLNFGVLELWISNLGKAQPSPPFLFLSELLTVTRPCVLALPQLIENRKVQRLPVRRGSGCTLCDLNPSVWVLLGAAAADSPYGIGSEHRERRWNRLMRQGQVGWLWAQWAVFWTFYDSALSGLLGGE